MFDKATRDAAAKSADSINVETEALLAVAEVESNGQVFALVNGRPEPLIRWEGHYFDQRLKGAERELARSKGLASPVAGKVKNPKSQSRRWDILNRAIAINKQAALESISVGVGQVMVAHWEKLGYDSAEDLLDVARSGAAGQIDVMARFIKKFGLDDELRRKDFTAFARGYNGAGFKKNSYHTRMAAAYRRLTGDKPVSEVTGMLRMGSHGARVRELQALLVRAGYVVKVDGDFGIATRDAVRQFQRKAKIAVDGVAGPQVFTELEQYRAPEEPTPGQMNVADVDEVKKAAAGGTGLAMITQFRDQISETASYLTGTGAEQADQIANYMLTGSAVLGVALAAWAMWAWVKSKKTVEGDV